MHATFQPSYLKLLKTGELRLRVASAYQHLQACDVCAWGCGIDRLSGKLGICKTGEKARLNSYGPHLGEEDPLRGWRGSGTIFFARCNLRCQYCQNYDISQRDAGQLVKPDELAAVMLELQEYGCHNINFVSPSHVVPQILAATYITAQAGLRLPLVYNTGGYDSLEMLRLLDGVVDIYMPDIKYADPRIARKYSKIPNYPMHNQAALREMHRQVGDLILDARGIAQRGLLVRHLILPDGLAGTEDVVRFLAKEISPHTYLNIMNQYHPVYKVHQYPELGRPITRSEYKAALKLAIDAGLERLDHRQSRIIFNF